MHKLIMAGLAVVALACGSSSGGSGGNEVNGTVDGRPFAAQDAVFNVGRWSNGFGFDGMSTAIAIGDFSGLCTFLNTGERPPSRQILVLVVAENDGSGKASPASSPGIYSVKTSWPDGKAPDSRRADGTYVLGSGGSPGNCREESDHSLAMGGGTVTVTAVGADRIEGTFDVTLEQGDRLTGSFSAPRCGTDCIPDLDPQTPECTGLNLNGGYCL